MAELLIPQKDSSKSRKRELEQAGSIYKYNYDAVIPLIEAEGPLDKNAAAYMVEILRVLMGIRANMDRIVAESGFVFERQLPHRDPKALMDMLASGENPVDYFGPDLGSILPSGRPTSINDYKSKIFIKDKAPSIADRFDTDEQFAYTFLAGPNPAQIQRMKAVPKEFPISNVQLLSVPEFAGDDLTRAIAEGRVYFVDHSGMQILHNGKHPQGPKYTYAPFAAFAVPRINTKKRLYPFAIQCGPTPQGREIYTPKDGFSWKIARNCVLAAHNNHHEVVTHLGLTHLLIDPIIASTRRNMHLSHPVHALLNKHFEGTVSINVGARNSLIKPGRSVDRLIGSDMFDNYKLLARERLAYSFRGNYLPTRLKRLMTDDIILIPNYPYRDDALLVWTAVHNWVAEFIDIYYKSDAEIRGDFELQAWAKEISTTGKILDFGVAPGSVADRADLIDILTMVIFTAGPQHAAVNFTQGSEMLFVPANPLAGYTPEPKGKNHTFKDWLDNFPPLDVAVHNYSILTLLSGVYHTRLGIYNTDVRFGKTSYAVGKFVDNLAEVERKIDARNKSRVEYVHLKPSLIPASVNI